MLSFLQPVETDDVTMTPARMSVEIKTSSVITIISLFFLNIFLTHSSRLSLPVNISGLCPKKRSTDPIVDIRGTSYLGT